MTDGRGRFLRDNAFLLAAVLLPVVVVAFYVLATAIPRWLVAAPAYDLLIRAEAPYDPAQPRVAVSYNVKEGKVLATVSPLAPTAYVLPSTLWLFEHDTMRVRRVPVEWPALAEGEAPRTIAVDALAGRRVAPDPFAPDGYEVRTPDRGGSGIVADLFGLRRDRPGVTIVKQGRVIRVAVPGSEYSSAYPVGWIVE